MNRTSHSPPRPDLPIDPLLPEITAALARRQNLIVRASPGSGKTTRIPPALLKLPGLPADKEILVLVPRRLAARMAALRVAAEMGEKVGGTVGYQFRFESVSSTHTRLKFLTEGMLLRHLIAQPTLPRAGIVILDEFHERHIHTDVALAMLRRLKLSLRPDLKLVVMSATLDAGPLARFLGDAPVIELDTPLHPVKIVYRPCADPKHIEPDVADAVGWALHSRGTASSQAGGIAALGGNEGPDHVLVFLPGMAQILRCTARLESSFGQIARILPLHGDLPREVQDQIFTPSDRPKIILATNIAESSLTIAGVKTVIDSGLHRQASHSFWNGVPVLKTRKVSRASAIQRAGRAGRTGPGTCVRLYSRADFDGRAEFERPEIQRADLSQVLVEILAAGVDDLRKFSWLEAPPAGAVEAATELLCQLGAVKITGAVPKLTPLGKKMAGLPLHPRLARLLIEAEGRGCLASAARLGALISEDALDELDALENLSPRCLSDAVRRLEAMLLKNFDAAGSVSQSKSSSEALAQAILTGFPDRVAQKRGSGKDVDLVFCGGSSATVANAPCLLEHEFFVVLAVKETQKHGQSRGRTVVKSLVPIQPEWLLDQSSALLVETAETAWDEQKCRVVRLSRLAYGQLILSETHEEPQDDEQTLKIFLKAALGMAIEDVQRWQISDVLRALSAHVPVEGLETELARIALYAEHFPSAQETKGSPVGFVVRALRGLRSLAELKDTDLAGHLCDQLSPVDRARLERLLPLSLTLPSGRRARIHYLPDKPPWVESRLQDFFGMTTAPSLMNGKIPLTLHLLAPNGRAVQVTSDLKGFWQKTYPELRGQLMRRYPRHKWPEKPG